MIEDKRTPKIRLLDIDELAPQLKKKALQWKRLGSDPTLFRVFGHLPSNIYLKFLEFYHELRYKGQIDVGLKEIVRIRIAHLNDCHY